MRVQEWGDICDRYVKILVQSNSKLRYPTMDEIAGTIPSGSNVIEGMFRRENRFKELLEKALTTYSPIMWYDLCRYTDRDSEQTFVIYPRMPSEEIDGVVTLIDENYHHIYNAYWPSDTLFRDMRNVVADRLVEDISRKKKGTWFGIFPKRIIYDENNITSLIELLGSKESLVVITNDSLYDRNRPNIQLNIYKKKSSDSQIIVHTYYHIEGKGERYVKEFPFSKFKPLGLTSKCFVLKDYELEEYLEQTIPGWMSEVSLELKKRLIRFAGSRIRSRINS